MQARFVNNGESVTVKADKNIAYGDLVKIGDELVGVAMMNILKGETGTVAIKGAFEVLKAKVGLKAGQSVYFKAADGNVTATDSDGPKLGITLQEAKTEAPTVVVKLVG
ncbi:DUF2190 family protein [Veillonella caviae]|uniref:DUF2190 family protein n=1 Tax=Veillonella caviae TaxID=248316 RepID=UPI002A916C1C|nr:DUF2190 family protein [Veillonella caviae]MDY5253985.1 DUF2190 family protein [Veillonella caviae]